MPARSLIRGVLITTLLGIGSAAYAYHTSTHRIISGLAVERSQIFQDSSILLRFGFPSVNEAVYGTTLPNVPSARNLIGVVGDGAVYEDDQYELVFCNHFFDPQHGGRGLNGPYFLSGAACWWGGGRLEGNPSPFWALEDSGIARDPAARTGVSEFSMRRGYASFRQAFIGTTPAERSQAMSRTMQSLGHVIHHLQDMAQPQHTRNEAHLHGINSYPGAIEGRYSQGGYEMYSEKWEGRIPGIVANNTYPTIGAQAFATARHLWYTPGSASPAYVGMAEFASHNFVGYEFTFTPLGLNPWRPTGVGPHPDFPLPNGTSVDGVPRRLESEPTTVGVRNFNQPISLTGRRFYVVGNVVDGLFPNLIHRDRKLAVIGLLGQPTEDEKVFDERHRILIPRAVGFSTAYIDYFFRGRIEISPTPIGDRWTLRNVGQFTLDGRVQMRTENAAGLRTAPANASPISLRLLPGESATVTFQLPVDARKVIAMFEGRIGNEGNLVFADTPVGDPEYHHVTGHVIDAPLLPTLRLSATGLGLPASGQAQTVSISLSSSPRQNEVITIARHSGSTNISASPSQLTFTTSNYSVPQSISISGLPNPSSNQLTSFQVSGPSVAPQYISVSQAGAQPVGCGQTIAVRGGTGTFARSMDMMGSNGGLVIVEFEAFQIPDRFEIRARNGGQVLSSSGGMVSGSGNYNFTYNPATHGRYVDITVVGNSDSSTQWGLGVSCPNGSAVSPVPKVPVRFGVTGVQGSSCTSSLVNTYRIDNGADLTITVSSSPEVMLTPGWHRFDFVSMRASNTCLSAGGWGGPTYTDPAGQKAIPVGAGVLNHYIFICGAPGCPVSQTPW